MAADWLRTKHLGTDQYFFGSVLHLLIYRILPNTPEDNLTEIWALCKQYIKDHQIKVCFGGMTLSMITKPTAAHSQFPRLKGKGVEVKAFGAVLRHVWQSYHDPNDMVHKKVALALKCSVHMEELMTTHQGDWRFPPEAADAM